MRILLIFLICLSSNVSSIEAQIDYVFGKITDNRDGKVYETIQLDSTIWLTENMQYKTESSDSFVIDNQGFDMEGYYYPYDESYNVCPNHFRIPKLSEWRSYVNILMEMKNIPKTEIKYNDTEDANEIVVSNEQLNIFEDPNPLKLKKSGYIEGTFISAIETMNFWIRRDGSPDFKYHVHISSNNFGNHTHKHHIIDKKKKKRKFVVRCVQDKVNK